MIKTERYLCGAVCAVGPVDNEGRRVGEWLIFYENGDLVARHSYPLTHGGNGKSITEAVQSYCATQNCGAT